MSKNIETPKEMLARAEALVADGRLLEKQAIKQAIVEGEGYLHRAALILERNIKGLHRLISYPGGRHHDLKTMLYNKRGRAPIKEESIAKRVKFMPKALQAAMNAVTHATHRKATGKAKLKGLPPLPKRAPKRTEEDADEDFGEPEYFEK
jgi:hypothetical protein